MTNDSKPHLQLVGDNRPRPPVSFVSDVAHTQGTDGSGALAAVEAFLTRFVAYPSEDAVVAHVLWIAHAHLIECFENTPRLAALSPEPGSGKSRLLEVTEPLVPRPVVTVNASSAYVFRKIADEHGKPTLLFDEVDTIFGGRPSDASEDLRGILNSGYRRGAVVGRATVRGKEVVTEEWPSFAAVALAGLNTLPDTIMTRSIVVRMRRRKATDRVLPYRRRVYADEAGALFDRLAAWAATVAESLLNAWPELPPGIEDRDADVWEPLIAVADAAGGAWPERARAAAVAFVTESHDRPATLGIKLLTDIKTVFDRIATDRIATVDLIGRLVDMESAPWASIKGEPIDARFLARQLGKYDIPTNNVIRIGGKTPRGYLASHFYDAWSRYVPEPSPEKSNTSNTGNNDAPTDHPVAPVAHVAQPPGRDETPPTAPEEHTRAAPTIEFMVEQCRVPGCRTNVAAVPESMHHICWLQDDAHNTYRSAATGEHVTHDHDVRAVYPLIDPHELIS